MWKLILGTLLLSTVAHADNQLIVNIGSKHIAPTKELSENNYGLGYATSKYSIGFYNNSYDKTSIYTARNFNYAATKWLSFGMQVGVNYGYAGLLNNDKTIAGLLPYVLPMVMLGTTTKAQIGYVPIDGGIITFQVSYKL